MSFDWPQIEGNLSAIASWESVGVREADKVIILLPGGRGAHVELGIAIGCRKPIYLVRSDIAFYYHGLVRRFVNIDELLEYFELQ